MYLSRQYIHYIVFKVTDKNNTESLFLIHKVLCKLLLDNQTPISVYSLLALDTYFSQATNYFFSCNHGQMEMD